MDDVSAIIIVVFYCLGHSSQEKVEDVSAIIILVLSLCVSKSRESGGRLSYHHAFLLLCVLKSREENVDGVSAITILFQTCSVTFGYSS